MYKRRENSFLVTAVVPKKFSDKGGWGRERQNIEKEKERENHYGGEKDYAIELHSPARRQMEDGENGARAKGCQEDEYSSIDSENSASRALCRCIFAAMPALI